MRRDPYVIEEYKDATLKALRQRHFLPSIKHAGIIRTSKSQQYAFEVVVKDDIVLLFGCENQILREEWIQSFIDVKRVIDDKEKKESPALQRPKQQTSHPMLERKGSLNGKFIGNLLFGALTILNARLTKLGL